MALYCSHRLENIREVRWRGHTATASRRANARLQPSTAGIGALRQRSPRQMGHWDSTNGTRDSTSLRGTAVAAQHQPCWVYRCPVPQASVSVAHRQRSLRWRDARCRGNQHSDTLMAYKSFPMGGGSLDKSSGQLLQFIPYLSVSLPSLN